MELKDSLFAGDCREVLKNIPENSISACITDPPYNYEFIGHKWDDGEIQRRLEKVKSSSTLVKNIPYGSGLAGGVRNERWYRNIKKNIEEYEQWCYEWGTEVYRVCKPGAFVVAFNSTRTSAHVQVALERAGFYARDIIVYRRSTGIPKGLNVSAQMKKKGVEEAPDWERWHSAFRSEWEAIVVVQKPLINNYLETLDLSGVGVIKVINDDGSFQSNILEGIRRDKPHDWNVHCTVKPMALMERLIELFVPQPSEHIVLDPFAGSGTTLVAAKKLGVRYMGIEIVPSYIDIIKRRLGQKIDSPEAPIAHINEQQETFPFG
ncbi:DNA-methyltransferase [Collimonas silvisoli]|uniref:DNA-methyltransferase n=1 Tax=Collimonas silvisoli TaxID=2825884 RepID=UPI001B8C343B|nr:site-specific DNA-methyltransferase [Collimonas silvisoli]